jgi:hypothetical protein
MALMVEAAGTSEASLNTYLLTRHNNPEDGRLPTNTYSVAVKTCEQVNLRVRFLDFYNFIRYLKFVTLRGSCTPWRYTIPTLMCTEMIAKVKKAALHTEAVAGDYKITRTYF